MMIYYRVEGNVSFDDALKGSIAEAMESANALLDYDKSAKIIEVDTHGAQWTERTFGRIDAFPFTPSRPMRLEGIQTIRPQLWRLEAVGA